MGMSITLDHLPFVRSKPCSVKSPDCKGPIIAHHLKAVGSGNDRKRPSYRHLSTVPLCGFHHIHIHGIGLKAFEEKYEINMFEYALSLVIEDIFGRSEPFFNDQIRD